MDLFPKLRALCVPPAPDAHLPCRLAPACRRASRHERWRAVPGSAGVRGEMSDMSLMRNMLLWGSQQAWLRDSAMRRPFPRPPGPHFMPGERLEDAWVSAQALQAQGIGAILTHLGENL